MKVYREQDLPGPLSAAAYRRHGAKLWACEAIETYEFFLAPRLTLKQGNDAALASLIRMTRSPAVFMRMT